MLTTTLDGLWALQVLAGIEVLAPELGLRPHLPSVESRAVALQHSAAAELRAAGVIDDDGAVDSTVLEWLTVLARRDFAVLLYVQTPADPNRPDTGEPERILLARFANWWVSIERFRTQVRLSGAGTATDEQSAARLIDAQIDRLCGRMAAAEMKPVTIAVPEILDAVQDSASLRTFLVDRRFDGDQVRLLTVAADPERSAQASVVAIQSGVEGLPSRCHIEPGVVTIIDTPHGRLVSEQVRRAGTSWMIVSPGSSANIAAAVLTMVRNLPAKKHWHSHRKVV
jgi:hypothetical protein